MPKRLQRVALAIAYMVTLCAGIWFMPQDLFLVSALPIAFLAACSIDALASNDEGGA